MTRNRRFFTCLLLFLIFVGILMPGAAYGAQERTRRVVSVVFDDSGSMYSGNGQPFKKWAYANYALQSFCGLLDKSDELSITYMSDFTKSIDVELADDKRQSSIDTIREKNDKGSTPFKAVESAAAHLKDEPVSSGSEYWLVVITDGEFQNPPGDLTDFFTRFNREMEAADKKSRVIFLAIGENTAAPQGTTDGSLIVKRANENQIIDSMSEIAHIISGRYEVKGITVKGDSIIFDSNIPLKSIVVFMQNTSVSVAGAGAEDKSSMLVPQRFFLDYPEESGQQTDKSLTGSICHLSPPDGTGNIKKGRYVVNLDSAVKSENIKVLFEPALDIAVKVHRGNNDEDGPVQDIRKSDTLWLEMTVVEHGTSNPIPLQDLPEGLYYGMTVRNGDEEYRYSGTRTEEITADSGAIEVSATVEAPGYFRIEHTSQYQVKPPLQISLEYLESSHWTAGYEDLDKAQPVRVVPLYDGERLSAQEFDACSLEILKIVDENGKPSKLDVSLERDESSKAFILKPKYSSFKPFTPTGSIQVFLRFESGQRADEYLEEDKLTLTIEDIPWYRKYSMYIGFFLGILLLLWYLYGLLIKPRFDTKKHYIMYTRTRIIEGTEVSHRPITERFHVSFFKRWFIPYLPEKVSIEGVIFKAGKKRSYIVLPKEGQNENMIVAGLPLGKNYGREDKRISQNQELFIKDRKEIQSFKYI